MAKIRLEPLSRYRGRQVYAVSTDTSALEALPVIGRSLRDITWERVKEEIDSKYDEFSYHGESIFDEELCGHPGKLVCSGDYGKDEIEEDLNRAIDNALQEC